MYLSSLISELNFYKDLKMLSKEFYIKIKEIYNKYKDYYNRPSSCFASDLKFKDCIVDLLLKDKNGIFLNRTYLESVKKLLNFTGTNLSTCCEKTIKIGQIYGFTPLETVKFLLYSDKLYCGIVFCPCFAVENAISILDKLINQAVVMEIE